MPLWARKLEFTYRGKWYFIEDLFVDLQLNKSIKIDPRTGAVDLLAPFNTTFKNFGC